MASIATAGLARPGGTPRSEAPLRCPFFSGPSSEAGVHLTDALRQEPHDGKRKFGILPHQMRKRGLVDRGDFAVLAGDRSRAAGGAVDERHLAKHAVGANALEHGAVGEDVDAPGADDVHGAPLVVLNENLLASRKTLQREARTREQRKIKPCLRHVPTAVSAHKARRFRLAPDPSSHKQDAESWVAEPQDGLRRLGNPLREVVSGARRQTGYD